MIPYTTKEREILIALLTFKLGLSMHVFVVAARTRRWITFMTDSTPELGAMLKAVVTVPVARSSKLSATSGHFARKTIGALPTPYAMNFHFKLKGFLGFG